MLGDTLARGSRRSRHDQRDTPVSVANRSRLLGVVNPASSPWVTSPLELLELEDRRTFHPDGADRDVRNRFGSGVAYTIGADTNRNIKRSRGRRVPLFSPQIGFEQPRQVLVCVRRKSRREVLFAKRRAGRGGNRPPRRSWRSNFSCR